jgi:hypothetical protein
VGERGGWGGREIERERRRQKQRRGEREGQGQGQGRHAPVHCRRRPYFWRGSPRDQWRARDALYGSPEPRLNSSRGDGAVASAIPTRWRLRGAEPNPEAKWGAGPESCGDEIGSAAAKEADATVDAAEHMLEHAEAESLLHSREPRKLQGSWIRPGAGVEKAHGSSLRLMGMRRNSGSSQQNVFGCNEFCNSFSWLDNNSVSEWELLEKDARARLKCCAIDCCDKIFLRSRIRRANIHGCASS